jgi:F-type H+-transporting ATPase subunit epsilon
MALQLEIVTPAQRILTASCDEVRLPGAGGGFGVRPGHTALVSALVAGELTYLAGGQTIRYAVGEGFGEVEGDRVRVLVEEAIKSDDLDSAVVQADLTERQKALAALPAGHPDFDKARALVERAAAKVLVAGRK